MYENNYFKYSKFVVNKDQFLNCRLHYMTQNITFPYLWEFLFDIGNVHPFKSKCLTCLFGVKLGTCFGKLLVIYLFIQFICLPHYPEVSNIGHHTTFLIVVITYGPNVWGSCMYGCLKYLAIIRKHAKTDCLLCWPLMIKVSKLNWRSWNACLKKNWNTTGGVQIIH